MIYDMGVENFTYTISAFRMLVQKECKSCGVKMTFDLHWCLCRKYEIEFDKKWYRHQVEKMIENHQDIVEFQQSKQTAFLKPLN